MTNRLAEFDEGKLRPHTRPQENLLAQSSGDGSIVASLGQIIQELGIQVCTPDRLHYFRSMTIAEPTESPLEKFRGYLEKYPPQVTLNLSTSDIKRWRMARNAWGNDDLLVTRCRDHPDMKDMFSAAIATGFSVAAFIYGGIHALAWSAHFRSSTEHLLWRMSTAVIMGGIPAGAVLFAFDRKLDCYFGNFGYDCHKPETGLLRSSIELLILVAAICLPLAYLLARAYLVVGCVINLFNLSADVYSVPSWPAYFPHIS